MEHEEFDDLVQCPWCTTNVHNIVKKRLEIHYSKLKQVSQHCSASWNWKHASWKGNEEGRGWWCMLVCLWPFLMHARLHVTCTFVKVLLIYKVVPLQLQHSVNAGEMRRMNLERIIKIRNLSALWSNKFCTLFISAITLSNLNQPW